MNIEVDFTGMDSNTVLQIDSSGNSLISEMTIYSRGTELERIQEYDTIAAILNDLAYIPYQRATRSYEGLGFKDLNNQPHFGKKINLKTNVKQTYDDHQAWYTYDSTGSTFCYSPKIAYEKYSSTNPWYNENKTEDENKTSYYPYDFILPLMGDNKNTSSLTGPLMNNETLTIATSMQACVATNMNYNPIGCQGSSNMKALSNFLASSDVSGGQNALSDSAKKIQYPIWPDRIERQIIKENTSQAPEDYISTLSTKGLYGWQCPLICSASWEPMFTSTWKQRVFKSGKPTTDYITKHTFCIPLISGLLGVLMPRDTYKYIPMEALKDLLIEFRLNPYAFFTSGYTNDIDSNITVPWPSGTLKNLLGANKTLTTQAKRNTWSITKFEINAEIMLFAPEINNIIQNQLNTGVILNTCSWYLGPQYLIQDSSQASGTWHVNLGFESLKSILFCYLLNDYKSYSFCRKQFRVSRNINSLQLKIGINYHPYLPIMGNSGDTYDWRVNGPNSEFLINLLKAVGKFNDIHNDNGINSANFAINGRLYDVTNTDPLFGKTLQPFQNTITPPNCFTTSSIDPNCNIHTAMGAPLLWENLYIGKAVYGFNLDGLAQDFSKISGLNTIKNTPFEIQVKTDTNGVGTPSYTDRPATMMVFCYYDMIIQIRQDGCTVLGRA